MHYSLLGSPLLDPSKSLFPLGNRRPCYNNLSSVSPLLIPTVFNIDAYTMQPVCSMPSYASLRSANYKMIILQTATAPGGPHNKTQPEQCGNQRGGHSLSQELSYFNINDWNQVPTTHMCTTPSTQPAALRLCCLLRTGEVKFDICLSPPLIQIQAES